MITPRAGASDPLLAFIPSWVAELASQVEQLWVVTTRYENVPLPDNVQIIQVGRDYSKNETIFHAIWNFHRALWQITRHEQIDGIFAHMYPKFALMAAPYAKLNRIPLILWFTHKKVSRQLWIASRFTDRILTAAPETCSLQSPKVVAIGHGIDTQEFAKPPMLNSRESHQEVILSLGRISPIKRIEVIIEAIRLLKQNPAFENSVLYLAGEPATPEQKNYLSGLQDRVEKHQLGQKVVFSGNVPHADVPGYLQQGSVFVSACNSGVDKAILEAMACEVPVMVSNPVFRPILDPYADQLMFLPENPASLAERLQALLSQPQAERDEIGKALRQIVASSHAIAALMGNVTAAFRELRTPKPL